MKLAEPVKAKVYVYADGQWTKSASRITIPAGYVVIYADPKELTPNNEKLDSKGH